MKSASIRYSVLGAGIVLVLLLMVPVIPFLSSARGVVGPSMADALHPGTAAAAMLAGVAACTIVGAVVGRLINAAVGLFVVGCGLAVVSMRSGTVMDIAFGGGSLRPVALETVAWGLAVAVISIVVFRVSGPLPDIPARDPKGPFRNEVVNADALRSMLLGLVAVAALWIADRSEMKGQSIFAAAAGAMFIGTVCRRLLGDSQPILLFAAPVLAVGVAQLITAGSLPGPLDRAVTARAVPGWSLAMPLDVAAGTLLGLPLGLGWSSGGVSDEE